MNSVRNDVLVLARAGAYSAVLCVFPIALVVAAILTYASAAEMVRAELQAMLYQMFPPDIPPLVLAYFRGPHRSLRLVLSAAGVFLLASNSVMTTLMKAMRRAYGLPEDVWTMTRRVLIAF
ncbi:MAG TPA: YhjD/YihY/BrkB family envelope integrity protein, partial [Rhizomicrobium sp.]